MREGAVQGIVPEPERLCLCAGDCDAHVGCTGGIAGGDRSLDKPCLCGAGCVVWRGVITEASADREDKIRAGMHHIHKGMVSGGRMEGTKSQAQGLGSRADIDLCSVLLYDSAGGMGAELSGYEHPHVRFAISRLMRIMPRRNGEKNQAAAAFA